MQQVPKRDKRLVVAADERRIDMNAFARHFRAVLLPMALVLGLTAMAAACPTCKEGLDQSDPHHQSIAAGFYYSILFMMSMPYLILGSLGYLAYHSIRRAKQQEIATAEG